MARSQDIDAILRGWPYSAGTISARRVRAANGREVLQMRVEMGVLQMEVTGRPDGQRPGGADTYLERLLQRQTEEQDAFRLSEEDCLEMDREFLQYYHRRICWLALRDFGRAVDDADHTLALMDFAAAHSPNEEWTVSHEQYRSFVLFHRTQAAALAALEENGPGPEVAIEEINRGLDQIRALYEDQPPAEESDQQDPSFDDDRQVAQLVQLKEWLREEYHVGRTLEEQLADAVAAEEYERAAGLRDQIARRLRKRPKNRQEQ